MLPVYGGPHRGGKKSSGKDFVRMHNKRQRGIMGSWGISKLGETGPVFVQPIAMVDGEYCRDHILANGFFPQTRAIAEDKEAKDWGFMQDNARPRGTPENVKYLSRNAPKVVSPWPANSPDLNPLDFSLWREAQATRNLSRAASTAAINSTRRLMVINREGGHTEPFSRQ